MQSVSTSNFGPLVAYLVPGATTLWGFSQFSTMLRSWFTANPTDVPTIGGFLYLTLASLAAGMIVSAVRWAVIDTLHQHTGLPMPALDFSKLGKNVEAFNLLIEIHYRFYQHHANMVVAILVAYACYRTERGVFSPVGWHDVLAFTVVTIFFYTSRDNLRKYHARAAALLGTVDTAQDLIAVENAVSPDRRA